jgi:hypothetical protein
MFSYDKKGSNNSRTATKQITGDFTPQRSIMLGKIRRATLKVARVQRSFAQWHAKREMVEPQPL